MHTIENDADDSGRSDAVRHAEAGAAGWRAAVRAQQVVTPDHGDFYRLAGLMVESLAAVESIGRVLARQAAGYADGVPTGQRLYDDTRTMDPRVRLEAAVAELESLVQSAGWAGAEANRFWSAIGHIGVEDVTG